MKKTVQFLIFILCCSPALMQAQVPNGISFQAVAKDANQNVASERTIHIKVNINENDANATVYSETFEVTSSREGIFSVVIGQGDWLFGTNSIRELDWSNNIYFLNLNVAVEPSLYDPSWNYLNEYVDLGTSQIWSVPHAFSADIANSISGIVLGANGGTGMNNEGKKIVLDGDLSLIGDYSLTLNTTGDTNVTLPTSGTLATLSDVNNGISGATADLSILQNEIDATQLNAGLNADGTYSTNLSTNYITTSTSIVEATEALDTQIKINTDAIAANAGSNTDALQTELDTTQTGAGLGLDGSYTPDSSTNYLITATSLTNADVALDAQIKNNQTNIATNSDNIAINAGNNTNLRTELNATQTGAGLAADGTYIADSSTNYITAVGSLTDADAALDTQININTTSITANATAIATNKSDTTALQTELDATQTAAGLGTDGTYSANLSTNYIKTATSLVNATEDLDTQIKTNNEAIATNATGNTSIQIELDATQTGSGLGTDGAYSANLSTNYMTTSTSIVEATEALDTQIKINTDAIAANAGSNTDALQTELDTTQTGAGLGLDGSYTPDSSTNYLTTATSLTNADVALDAQIKNNQTNIATNSDNIAINAGNNTNLRTELNATQTGAGLAADGTYIADSSTNYITAVGSLTDADAALDTQININTTSITANATAIATNKSDTTALQTELDATQTAAGLGTDGTYSTNLSTNYIKTATSLVNATEDLDTQIKTNNEAIATNATRNTSIQLELDATQTGSGLGLDGSYTADSSTNYLTVATSLINADVVLDAQIKNNQTNITANSDNIAINAGNNIKLEAELDITQTGAGLGTDGAYTPDSSTNYLTAATSLANADVALDAQIKNNQTNITANSDNIAINAGNNIKLEAELDITQTGAGLGTDGAYTPDSSTNYLTAATSLANADVALDAQIKNNQTNIATNSDNIGINAGNNTNLRTELNATQTGAGLAANGTYITNSSTNYLTTVGSLADADAALDTQININTTSIITNATAIAINTSDTNGLKTELDATQTGAGLGTDGTYSTNLSTNYITTSTSLVDATEDLDTQIKTNTDAIVTNATSNTNIQSELDATQTGAGLGTDGAYTANGSTNYLTTVTSLTSADVALDTQIKTNTDAIVTNAASNTSIQTELDATQTGAGLGTDGAYTANGSTNYLTTVTSLTSADVALDTQIKTNTDAIVTNATSNTSIQTELDATQTGAGLGTDGAYTANGSTNYLTTVTSLTSADVALDTQIKTNTDAIVTNAASNTSIQTELDATQTGAGLGTDGAYTANGSTNYLTTVTSLTSADVALDTQIKTNTDAIVTNATSNTNIQSELDATQAGAGLGTDGAYTADGSTNYLTTVTSLTSADVALDTQIKTNTDAIATNATSNTSIQTELDATQTGAGLGTDGAYTANGSTNYLTTVTSLTSADVALDTQIKTNTDAIVTNAASNTSIQTELDATQTGAGLGTDGAYTANGSTNYLTTVTSLTSADVALDTQIKTNTDAIVTNATSNTNIQSELDATQAGAGLGTDGAYTADGSTNYLTTVTSLTSADVALDTQLKRFLIK
ncbi:hypothetical protein BST83_02055 [Polaribacter filamentus]|uniref:Uncharacterized protein n=1 Tax=Polaribacter filamentus TaxID=53483 RepID=A0A2S7KU67_9FLAO|nr:S-layer family protein [Polaribacter filamentus]PQB06098.1 hypothetical protein BST83_02055 [Polaribacter filamentus]